MNHGMCWVGRIALGLALAGGPAAADEAKWWMEPQRLLQTNLREIDATMDVDRYVQDVKDFGANVVLFNVGGIVANYPTELEFHWRNRHLRGDLVGTVLARLHAEGIRMIGRFDFSKINETLAARRPEWLYVGSQGETVNYNGQVHTCVSGGYQQEYMFKILGEAVDRYPLDGVFFNMIGFTKSDYSGNYHGICQCRNCRRLFKEATAMALPKKEGGSGPAIAAYRNWTRSMTDRQFTRVHDFLKGKRKDLAICTYTSAGVDIIRKESNRALGQGTYHDTETAKWTLLTCGKRQLACASVYFMRIPYRHAAVSPGLTARRLWQQMVNGAWLDFYCIGPLGRQEDRTGLDAAAGIFRLKAAGERWLEQTRGAGEIGLVRRGGKEFEGILQILSENHMAFEAALAEAPQLGRFHLVIVPDAGGLSAAECASLDRYVKGGGKLLLTGKIPGALRCMGPVTHKGTRPREKGAYIRIRPEDRQRLKRPVLDKLDLVFLSGPFEVYEPGDGVEGLLRLIPPDMFGPPEKCYYRKVSEHPALLYHRYGSGAAACFTFGVGEHYEAQCHTGHAGLLAGAVDNLLACDRRLEVVASPLVEISHREDSGGRFEWVALFNHSGQAGRALHAPIPVRGVEIRLKPRKKVRAVDLLAGRGSAQFKQSGDGRILVTVPELQQYEIVVFEYE